MDESSDALDSAVYAAELYNQIQQEQMMGLNSVMGQGIIGNANNSMMGSGLGIGNAAQQATWNAAHTAQLGPQVIKSMYPDKQYKPRLNMSLSIVQADNGFIVNIQGAPYTDPAPHIATTIEDICTIITSQLASRMLERTE